MSSLVSIKHKHLGYGMVLIRRKSDGTVWVASRLLQSPAGYAGVKLFSKLIQVNDVRMSFPTDQEFGYWAVHSIPKEGCEDLFLFADGSQVHMAPVLITEDIPVYWSPNEKNCAVPHPDVHLGLTWCEKTGQYIPTAHITTEALAEVYFGGEL